MLLSIYRTDPSVASVSFTTAQEICRMCVDGDLVQGEDTALLKDYLPTWLGVVQDVPPDSNGSTFHWLNGSEVSFKNEILWSIAKFQFSLH